LVAYKFLAPFTFTVVTSKSFSNYVCLCHVSHIFCRSAFIIFFVSHFFVNHFSVILISRSYGSCYLSILFVNLGYSFFIKSILFVILVFFVALVITLFVVSRYLIKNILLILSSIIIIILSYFTTCHLRWCITSSLRLDSMNKTLFYDDFEELNFGYNFSFHVINLSFLYNLLQIQHYYICLAFEGC
jgi:hypothetical protein